MHTIPFGLMVKIIISGVFIPLPSASPFLRGIFSTPFHPTAFWQLQTVFVIVVFFASHPP